MENLTAEELLYGISKYNEAVQKEQGTIENLKKQLTESRIRDWNLACDFFHKQASFILQVQEKEENGKQETYCILCRKKISGEGILEVRAEGGELFLIFHGKKYRMCRIETDTHEGLRTALSDSGSGPCVLLCNLQEIQEEVENVTSPVCHNSCQ